MMNEESNISNSVQENEGLVDMSKLEESLECPICYNIPRVLPISSCEAGHIVCESCRKNVTQCPTCRRNLNSNCSNSIAGQLIDLVNFKCKYTYYGCKVKKKVNEIDNHEQCCFERTIICPLLNCVKVIQLKKFKEHVSNDHLPVNSTTLVNNDWSGESVILKLDNFNVNKDKIQNISSMVYNNHTFYLLVTYIAVRKSFYFSIILPDDSNNACNYISKIKLLPRHDADRSITYEGLVSSIEDLPRFNRLDHRTNVNYWSITYEALKGFVAEYNYLWVVVQVKKKSNKRKRT